MRRCGFIGDWPAEMQQDAAVPRVGERDTGVRYLNELCPSCDGPINKATGECRCSK